MKGRNKLWISGVLVLVGFFLARMSYSVLHQSIALALLIVGVITIVSGLVLFWFNFRE